MQKVFTALDEKGLPIISVEAATEEMARRFITTKLKDKESILIKAWEKGSQRMKVHISSSSFLYLGL